MNIFLGGLESALSDLSDLGVLPKKELKFILLYVNEARGVQVVEHIGEYNFLPTFNKIDETLKQKCCKVQIKVISLYDDSVGVTSDFGNSQIEQAISVLWVVVRNYIKNHPEDDQGKDSFWQRVIEEVRILEKILELKNPCVCEICKMISRNKKRLIFN